MNPQDPNPPEPLATESTVEAVAETTDELDRQFDQILEDTRWLRSQQLISSETQTKIELELKNLRLESKNNSERLSQIQDLLQSLQLTRSTSLTPELTPTLDAEGNPIQSTPPPVGRDVVDPQVQQTVPEKKVRKFRMI